MANFEISWSIEGEKQLSRVLLGLGSKVKDLSEPMQNAATTLRRTFESDVFATRGATIGARWKPLRPATLRDKLQLGYPTDPLVRTGQMQRSFRTIVSRDQAVIYNTADYFKYHQSKQPRMILPRRMMMRLNEQLKQTVVKIFHDYLRNPSGKLPFEP